MSILDKAKALKKQNIQVKGTVHLHPKSADALDELMKIVGSKELVTIALNDPKSLLPALRKNKKIAKNINLKIEISAMENEALEKIMAEGYSMDEILSVALSKLNVVKSLEEIQTEQSGENSISQKEEQENNTNQSSFDANNNKTNGFN